MDLLHAMELGRRMPGVHAVSYHPGNIASGFARDWSPMMRWLFNSPLRYLLFTTPERGAERMLRLIAGAPGTALGLV